MGQGTMDDKNKTPSAITPLIRQYSLKAYEIMPENPLSQALVSVINKEDSEAAKEEESMVDWKTWIEFGSCSNDIAPNRLEQKRRAIIESWKRFLHSFPDDDNYYQFRNSVPTIATLQEAINQAQIAWNKKQERGWRKWRNGFINFADTMNDYSYLFSIIPDGDKYTSLVTGVVSSVVKVSINYKKTADGFSQILSEVAVSLHTVNKMSTGVNTDDMRANVVSLYCEIFDLLCYSLTWFSSRWKRFGAAFNKGFYDDTVKDLLSGIDKAIRAVELEADCITRGQVQDIHGWLGPHLDNRLRAAGNQNRRDNDAAVEDKFDKMKEALGSQSVQTLGSVEQQEAYERLEYQKSTEIWPLEQEPLALEAGSDETSDASENDPHEQCSRYDIEQFSARLAVYRENREETSTSLPDDPLSLLPQEVVLKMQQWIKTSESKTIWVQGLPSMPQNSVVSHAAARICIISIQTGLPCVSFFCQPRYSFANDKKLTQKEAGLVALLYTVVSQLACLLPEAFPETDGLNEGRFNLLDGTMESTPVALDLIRALLTHAPSSLIWVMDGLQLVESNTTIPHLRAFLEILREQETKRVSKACFTTQGNCFVLTRAIDVKERVDASRIALNRPGAILRGGSGIHELGGPATRRL